MSTPQRPSVTQDACSPLPRRLRWLHPLLALTSLGALPPAAPARAVETTPAIERVQELRARLRLADFGAAQLGGESRTEAAESRQVAQWQKWNDWNNWSKWGKQ